MSIKGSVWRNEGSAWALVGGAGVTSAVELSPMPDVHPM